jgi:4-hydroxybenzoate polyprenyltransferase
VNATIGPKKETGERMGPAERLGRYEAGSPLGVVATLRLVAGIGRIHITTIAALGLFTFGWLFTDRYPWLLTGICALDWYLVNLVNRVVDVREDEANAIAGTRFAREKGHLLLILAVAALGVSFILIHLAVPQITFLRIAFHALGAAYNWPCLPGGRRLKEIYFWKNTASAMGFIITLFGYPLAAARFGTPRIPFPDDITWGTVLLSGLFFFLFELSYEVIYDLRDVRGDALAGIRTYPVVHGVPAAVRIVDGLIFSSMGVLALGYAAGPIPWRIFIMIVPPVMVFFLYKRACRRGLTAADCIRLTWIGAGLIVLYHLWVVLGLPGSGM